MSSRSRSGKRIVIPQFVFAVDAKGRNPSPLAFRPPHCAATILRRKTTGAFEPRLSKSSNAERVFVTRARIPPGRVNVPRLRPGPG
jgi:hypothetical protein